MGSQESCCFLVSTLPAFTTSLTCTSALSGFLTTKKAGDRAGV